MRAVKQHLGAQDIMAGFDGSRSRLGAAGRSQRKCK